MRLADCLTVQTVRRRGQGARMTCLKDQRSPSRKGGDGMDGLGGFATERRKNRPIAAEPHALVRSLISAPAIVACMI